MCVCVPVHVCVLWKQSRCVQLTLKQQRFELCGFELTPGLFSVVDTTVLCAWLSPWMLRNQGYGEVTLNYTQINLHILKESPVYFFLRVHQLLKGGDI